MDPAPASWAALLSGEHPTLPRAELAALLAVHAPAARLACDGLVAFITAPSTESPGVAEALRRAALVHEAGPLLGSCSDDHAGLAALAARLPVAQLPQGTWAVVAVRRGAGHGATLRSSDVERALGASLVAGGRPIGLRSPDAVVAAWLGAGQSPGNQAVAVWRHVGDHRSAYEARKSDARSHFSPISLHPRRAASLVHLARVPAGGRLYDPFCGTGAFVLEAALEGYDVYGSDLDAWMVQGTWQTLTDVPPQPLDATIFEADIADAPDLVPAMDGIVTDLPYGRASTAHDEGLAALYERAFAAFARILPPGRRLVVGHADPRLLAGLGAHGFMVVEEHAERAHRSLTRSFTVAVRAPSRGG